MNIVETYERLSKTGDKLAEEESIDFTQGFNACLFLLKRAIKDGIINPKQFEVFYENNKLRAQNERLIERNKLLANETYELQSIIKKQTIRSSKCSMVPIRDIFHQPRLFDTNASEELVRFKLFDIFEKQIKNRRKKYTDKMLMHHLTQDLRTKGYIIEEIKDII